jgi:phospholipase/carboxylesterase
MSFLEAAPTALGTDPARQYVVGFSQGATIGWTLAASTWPRPDLLRGLCLLRRVLQHPPRLLTTLACARDARCSRAAPARSGRLFEEHAQAGAPLAAGVAPAAALRGRAIWATHGVADGVTPASLARDSLQVASTLLGGDTAGCISFQPHNGGHEIPAAALQGAAAALLKWNQ